MYDSANLATIPEFFAGRSVFLTGASGFLGKVLIEKLLRSCPSIKTIYVLIRPKRGKDVQTRVKTMLDVQLFDVLKEQQPDYINKVVAIPGDIVEPNLGVSEQDWKKIYDNVSVVFHAAATVRFDEELKLALQKNVLATKTMLEMCRDLPKLDAFIHVSTAYSNCDRFHVEEIIYPPPMDPYKLIETADFLSEDVLKDLTPRLIYSRPNTYTFTKALAEAVIERERGNMPVAIVRPSIIGATFEAPFAGWVDNFMGPSGILAAVGTGMCRTVNMPRTAIADVIPVDQCANAMIATAWYTGVEKLPLKVYNITSGTINKCTWADFEDTIFVANEKYPLLCALRVPGGKSETTWFMRQYRLWVDHYLPAYAMDIIFRLIRRKPIFVDLQTKIWANMSHMDFFTTNQWLFSAENVEDLRQNLSPQDREEFDFDVKKVHWSSYIENYVRGVKLYALKEDISTIDAARNRIRRMVWFNRVTNAVVVLIVSPFIIKRVPLLRENWSFLVDHLIMLVKGISSASLAAAREMKSNSLVLAQGVGSRLQPHLQRLPITRIMSTIYC